MPTTTVSLTRGVPFELSIPEEDRRILVSMVIPVYNGDVWIKILLDGICRQLDENPNLRDLMEIIISIDSPTDGSDIVCDEAAKKFPEVIKCVHHPNVGLVGNRNIGMQLSQGEYIIFADHDDYFPDGALSRIVELLEIHKPDILTYRATLIDKNGHFISKTPVIPTGEYTGSDFILKGGIGFGTLWDNAIKSEIIRNNNLYSIKYWLSEDYDIRLKSMLLAKRVYGVDECLYSWRCWGNGSASHNETASIKYFEAKLYYIFNHFKFLSNHSLVPKKIRNFIISTDLKTLMVLTSRVSNTLSDKDKRRIRRLLNLFKKIYLKKSGIPKDIYGYKSLMIITMMPYANFFKNMVSLLRKANLMKIPGKD